ncbi:aspartic peptidase domain-containing protein [Ampelomyces quisqualis]|uniref:Aspartic peptidase domain-containing protein n=1 Tax=Ampelomyces quisqualis TaxID=50730 RepID=A0A6A5R3C1_AMPQU|nr:aspartic peptidase domain-containing protein [Ampelomyces quisqualis]
MYYFSEFYLGFLGLAVGTISPTGAVLQTFFSGLAGATDVVASNSYGFTAGASYRNGGRGIVGNMVFGGYDISRVKMQQGVSIPLPSQQNNTLIVGVNSIIHTPDQDVEQGSTSFTDRGFSAIIDSTLPYLVLPGYICDRFIEKFGLTFDNTTALYTVNSTVHERNQQQNATVAFKISAQPQDSSTSTTIVFPYEAFFLQASDPIFSPSQYYFPIRKSSNGYNILGRSFLQEAYIVVDYERANFTVAPAAVFSGAIPSEELVTIYNTTYVPPKGAPSSGKGGLSAGAIAGIVIGIIAVFLLIGGGAFLYHRRRRDARNRVLEQEGKPTGIDTIVAGGEIKHRRVSELTGSEPPYSPQTKPVGYYGGDHKSIPELSPESYPAELYSPPADGEADYFAPGSKPRRRRATRDSSGQNTPGTPVAELAGDAGLCQGSGQHFEAASSLQRPQHIRGPSDKSLSIGIDEIMSGQDRDNSGVHRKHSSKFVEHTGVEAGPSRAEMVVSPLENTRVDEADTAAESIMERRPSHARGISDITINSDSTAVSQPTPEEMERWARSVDDAPDRSATT